MGEREREREQGVGSISYNTKHLAAGTRPNLIATSLPPSPTHYIELHLGQQTHEGVWRVICGYLRYMNPPTKFLCSIEVKVTTTV